jgi:hypothetical protein
MRPLFDDLFRPFKHHLLTMAFLGGFVVDNLTLNRVDQLFDNAVLAGYVILAMIGLVFLYAGTSGRLGERTSEFAGKWAPLLVQFAFGGLMSGLLVFYSRSGSWWTSWPFLVLMLAVIVGNEFITKRASRLLFNLGVFFVALFSYVVLIVPVLLGRMGDEVFLISGVVALLVFVAFLKILYKAVPNFMAMNTRMVVVITAAIYLVLNALYFSNLIPPIPLSMKEMGAYHNVSKRAEGGYVLTYEKGPWYALWHHSDNTFHYAQGDRVYCYASVFAPARFKTSVRHRWEYFDTGASEWKEHYQTKFSIDGGRDEGYRGYSFIESVREGAWRCSVETERGQVVGRTIFTVVKGAVPRALVTRVDL